MVRKKFKDLFCSKLFIKLPRQCRPCSFTRWLESSVSQPLGRSLVPELGPLLPGLDLFLNLQKIPNLIMNSKLIFKFNK